MKEVQYRNMTIEELVSNWEVDDSSPTYKDTLIQKLLEQVETLVTEISSLEKEYD